jgi:GPI-anchor transamidase subunit U
LVGQLPLTLAEPQSPLLLPLFSLLPGGKLKSLATGLLYTMMDLANANALAKIADSGEAVSTRLFTSPRRESRLDGADLSIAYLLNPFTIGACFGRSTSAFTNTAIIHAVFSSIDSNAFRAMFALALASYLSMYPILLFPPLALLCWDQAVKKTDKNTSSAGVIVNLLASLFACINGLLWLSFMVMGGSWEFLSATYGFQLSVPDLTPNVGLWWYFFIEIFDSFREFFLGTFWLHLAAYVGGLTLRVRRQPLFVITTLLGLFAIFKPYPSISDVSLYLAFVPLYKHVFPRKSTHHRKVLKLTAGSDAIYLYCHICAAVCKSTRTCILSPLDICRVGKCKFLLCHHPSLESGAFNASG